MSAKISLRLTALVVFTTLVFTLLGWILPEFLRFIQYPLLGILLVTIGLPHGATDYLLFRRMHRSKLTKKQIFRFFAIYVTAVLGFLLFWLIFPLYSFIIFIVPVILLLLTFALFYYVLNTSEKISILVGFLSLFLSALIIGLYDKYLAKTKAVSISKKDL